MRVRDHIALSTAGAVLVLPRLRGGALGLWAGSVLIDTDHYEIPLPVTTAGTMVGLVGALLWSWPWPAGADAVPPRPPRPPLPGIGLGLMIRIQPPGLYAWLRSKSVHRHR